MLLSAFSVLVVAQSSSEVPEGLMNNPIYSRVSFCLSQWPRGLRRRSTAACPLRLCVRIPAGGMYVCLCECCVLSGRGLCDGLITRPEESYRLWRVVCDHISVIHEVRLVHSNSHNLSYKFIIIKTPPTCNFQVFSRV